jgi:hypothetical protein
VIYVNVYLLPDRDTSGVRVPLPSQSMIFGDHAYGPHIEARRAAIQARLNANTQPDGPAFLVVTEDKPALALVTPVTERKDQ